MFEPKTHWEKRVVALENLFIRFAEATRTSELLQDWHAEREHLKLDHAQEILGPVLLPVEERAYADYIAEKLYSGLDTLKLVNFDRVPTERTDEERQLAASAFMRRVGGLRDLDEALASDFTNGLYRMFNSAGSNSPCLAVIENRMLFIFIIDAGFHFMSLSLDHLPEGFDFSKAVTTERGRWRTELFVYREELPRTIFDAVLAEALAAQKVVLPEDETPAVADAVVAAAADEVAQTLIEDVPAVAVEENENLGTIGEEPIVDADEPEPAAVTDASDEAK